MLTEKEPFTDLPDDVLKFVLLKFLDPFELCKGCLLLNFRWHLLVQESLKNRRCGIDTWNRRPENLEPSLLKKFIKLNVFEMSDCGQNIYDYCISNIEKFWRISQKICERHGDCVNTFKDTVMLSVKLSYPMKMANYWLAAFDSTLKMKFEVLAEKKRSISSLIQFAEFIEGYVCENELATNVVRSVELLANGFSSIFGILQLVDRPWLFEKLPALFSEYIFYSSLTYTNSAYTMNEKARKLCCKLLESHSNFPNFNPEKNIVMLKKIVDANEASVIRAYLMFVKIELSKENTKALREIFGNFSNTEMMNYLVEFSKENPTHSNIDVNFFREIPTNKMFQSIQSDSIAVKLLQNHKLYPNVDLKKNNWELFISLSRSEKIRAIKLFLEVTEVSEKGNVLLMALEEATLNPLTSKGYKQLNEFELKKKVVPSRIQQIEILCSQKSLKNLDFDPSKIISRIIRFKYHPNYFHVLYTLPTVQKYFKKSMIEWIFIDLVRHKYWFYGFKFFMSKCSDEEIIKFGNVDEMMGYFANRNYVEGVVRCFYNLDGDPTYNNCEVLFTVCEKLGIKAWYYYTFVDKRTHNGFELWKEAVEKKNILKLLLEHQKSSSLSKKVKNEVLTKAIEFGNNIMLRKILECWKREITITRSHFNLLLLANKNEERLSSKLNVNNYNNSENPTLFSNSLDCYYQRREIWYLLIEHCSRSELSFLMQNNGYLIFLELCKDYQVDLLVLLLSEFTNKIYVRNWGVVFRSFMDGLDEFKKYEEKCHNRVGLKFEEDRFQKLMSLFFLLEDFKKNIKQVGRQTMNLNTSDDYWGNYFSQNYSRKLIWAFVRQFQPHYLRYFSNPGYCL